MKKKSININLGTILIIVVIIVIIGFIISRFSKKDNTEEIKYTNQLNYTTYTDDKGNYVIEYENGDKTIETRQPKK